MTKKKNNRKLLYEGKAKIIYEGTEAGTIIQYFKDDMTAFNGKKHEVVSGKGVLNNRISEYIMQKLEDMGIYTHFIKSLNMREQLCKACDMVPLEFIVRNVSAGSFEKRFGLKQGTNFYRPLVETCLKDDELGDPFVSDEHIDFLGISDIHELDAMKNIAIRVNDFLSGMFYAVGIKLVDFKLEFGRVYDEYGNVFLLVADEISPDSCRLWDIASGNILDKDRFRQDLGDVTDSYREVARRLGIINDADLNVVDIGSTKTPDNNK